MYNIIIKRLLGKKKSNETHETNEIEFIFNYFIL